MTKQLNKAELEKQKVLAFLDAEDSKVPANPGILNAKSERGDFENLFEASMKEQDFKVGDVVTGKVVEVQSDYVLVDINYKSEGLIAINEFRIVDGVRRAAHVVLPRVGTGLAPPAGLFLPSKRSADLRATRPGVHIRQTAIRTGGRHKQLGFPQIIREDR